MRKLVAQTETNTATMPRMRRLVVMRWRMSILAWRASAEMAATKHRALVAAGLWPAVEGDVPPSGHMHRSLRRISDFHAAASGQDARLYGRRGRPPLLHQTHSVEASGGRRRVREGGSEASGGYNRITILPGGKLFAELHSVFSPGHGVPLQHGAAGGFVERDAERDEERAEGLIVGVGDEEIALRIEGHAVRIEKARPPIHAVARTVETSPAGHSTDETARSYPADGVIE